MSSHLCDEEEVVGACDVEVFGGVVIRNFYGACEGINGVSAEK